MEDKFVPWQYADSEGCKHMFTPKYGHLLWHGLIMASPSEIRVFNSWPYLRETRGFHKGLVRPAISGEGVVIVTLGGFG